MKTILSVIPIVVILISCSQESTVKKSDLEIANLRGKVLMIEKIFHDAGAKCACPAAQKDECNRSSFTYDGKGNLKESKKIDENGRILLTSKYIYNRKGLCTEIDHFSDEKLVSRELSIIKDNKVSGLQILNEAGQIQSIFNYTYNGEDISMEQIVSSEGVVTGAVQNVFENGLLISQTKKDEDGNVVSVTRFKRNASSDIEEVLISVPGNNAEYKLTFEYEYDEQGNWIKQTQVYNGEIQNISIRNITYVNS